MTQRLDIAIGPVQGFVTQSRRTRDLWGSSYLLAFLAGHAMHGAEKAGGRIVRPVVDNDALYAWITGKGTGGPPGIGSLPNRFAVAVDGDIEASEVARAADEALRSAWARVCDAVWGEFVKDACELGAGTRAIWDRQTGVFWEAVWAAGPVEAGLLARRKYWRSHVPPAEPGDKCTVMHDLQELSGHVRTVDRDVQNYFWECIRSRVGALELRDNERLCAIAFIKRLFPIVAKDALGWEVKQSRWPSTVHIAARPWLRQVETCAPDLARDYARLVKRSAPSGVLSERRPPWPAAAGDFHRLDANWFYREAVGSERLCPLKPEAGDEARDALAKALEAVGAAKDRDGRRLRPPSSFYALLLADGDRLGRLAGETGGEHVGLALAKFTLAVPKIVREHCGETVYAGGDDVLAMLPVPGALRCAAQLANCYRSAFEARARATLSAAVVFVHVRYPLGSALREAHRLLDDVAKDENGRDSLAVGILKPGGLNSRWVTTWCRKYDDGRTESSVDLVQKLVESLENQTSETGLSSALLYRIRELLVRLCGWGSWRPGDWGAIPADIDLLAFLRAEIGHSLAVRRGDNDEAQVEQMTKKMADLVWRVLQRAPADEQDSGTDEGADRIGVDALLLARFLAAGGHSEQEA